MDSIACGGRRPGKIACFQLAGQVRAELDTLSKKTVVVLQLLDDTTYFARIEKAGLIPWEALSVRYHVDGDLGHGPCGIPGTQPGPMQTRVGGPCKPVLEGHKDCKKLILSSLPLFLTLGCCGDVTHAPSRHDLPFATSGLERVRKSTHALCNNASQVRNPL